RRDRPVGPPRPGHAVGRRPAVAQYGSVIVMAYVSMVRPRWSDMDAFGHVNHAKTVTLLEEARVPLLFDEASRVGLTEMAKGMVVVRLAVHYRAPIVVDGQAIRVEVTLRELKFASLTLDYRVHSGPSEAGEPRV